MSRIFQKFLLVALSISALSSLVIIIFGLWQDLSLKVFFSNIIIYPFMLLALGCFSIFKKDELKIFSILGMLVNFITAIYLLLIVWGIIHFKSFNIIIDLIVISLSITHISVLLLINPNSNRVKIIRLITILLSILLCIFMIFDVNITNKIPYILVILIIFGTVATPIINEIESKNNNIDKYKKIEQLKHLLDNGAITNEEFEKEKSKILNN